ncbi:MAG: hypothetical protein U0935_13100 [Pirellulales bacterium]
MIEPGSRYEKVGEYTITDSLGRRVTLLQPRLLPQPAGVLTRRVQQADRPDLLAHEFYRQSDLSWHLADANLVMDPAELTDELGRLLQIPPRP